MSKLKFDEMAALHVSDLFGYRSGERARRKVGEVVRVGKKKARKFVLPPSKIPSPEIVHPIECPCCKQAVEVPTLDIVIDHYGVPNVEAKILGAVWRGKGHPVQTNRIFDAMYADDPDGGPEPAGMYSALKANLHSLRCRLAGSGVNVENVGYRQGYRLVLGKKKKGVS